MQNKIAEICKINLAKTQKQWDLDTFGHAFENMVIRDLLAYAQAHDASILHYRDDNGLEADAVYQMADGRYALIEIKTGANAIPAAESSLLKFGQLIEAHNEAVLKDLLLTLFLLCINGI